MDDSPKASSGRRRWAFRNFRACPTELARLPDIRRCPGRGLGLVEDIWVYLVEHAPDTVSRARRQAAEPIMSLKVYALKGGFSAETKTRMVTEATAILGKHSKTDHG